MNKASSLFIVLAATLAACSGSDTKTATTVTTQTTQTDSTTASTEPLTSITDSSFRDTSTTPSATAPATAAIPLQFRLQKGKKYDYGMDFNIAQGGQGMVTTMKMGYDLAVTGDDGKLTTLQATFKRIAMGMAMGEQTMEFSSENPGSPNDPFNLPGRMFSVMKGKSFTMQVDRQGKIVSVTGMDKIGEELVKEMNVGEDSKGNVRKNFQGQFNDNSIKEMFSSSFEIYPDKPVKVGDTWKRKTETKLAGGKSFSTTYKVKSIRGNNVEVEGYSSTPMEEAKGSLVQQSRMTLDARTGLVIQGEFQQTLNGQRQMTSKGRIVGKEL